MKFIDHWRAWTVRTKTYLVVIAFLTVCFGVAAVDQTIDEARFKRLPAAEQAVILEQRRLAAMDAARAHRQALETLAANRAAQDDRRRQASDVTPGAPFTFDEHPYFAIYLIGCISVVLLYVAAALLHWTVGWLTGARVAAKNLKKLQSVQPKPVLSRVGTFLWMFVLNVALSWISAAIQAWRILAFTFGTLREFFARTPEIVRELRYPLNRNPNLPRESVWAYLMALNIRAGGVAPPDEEGLRTDLDNTCAELPHFDRTAALRQLDSLKVVDPAVIVAAAAPREDSEEDAPEWDDSL